MLLLDAVEQQHRVALLAEERYWCVAARTYFWGRCAPPQLVDQCSVPLVIWSKHGAISLLSETWRQWEIIVFIIVISQSTR